MAGASESTVLVTSGTTVGVGVNWMSIKTDGGTYFDVNNVDTSKAIILVAYSSTQSKAAARYLYIGTTDTASSASTLLLYSGGGKRGKFALTTGDSYFNVDSRDAGTSGLYAVTILGPLETAHYKDTDGHIGVAVPASGCTGSLVAMIAIK